MDALLQRFLAGRGLAAATVSNAEVQHLIFPDLDEALSDVLPEDIRRSVLRKVLETLVAEQLGASVKRRPSGGKTPLASVPTATAAAAPQWSEDDLLESDDVFEDDFEDDDLLEGDDLVGGVNVEAASFEEDEFELDDPEYLDVSQSRSFDFGDAADQTALIRLLGRVSGVRSVMICRRNGEVVQARSVSDLTKLGSVVAAAVMLLRGQALRLLSAQVGGQIVCVRPLGDYAIAVLADSDVNIGRLLTELSGLQGGSALSSAAASAGTEG